MGINALLALDLVLTILVCIAPRKEDRATKPLTVSV